MNLFKGIKTKNENALGNNINDNLAIYNKYDNLYYIVDPYEIMKEPQNAHELPYIFAVTRENDASKIFSHYGATKLKLEKDELFFLASYLRVADSKTTNLFSRKNLGYNLHLSTYQHEVFEDSWNSVEREIKDYTVNNNFIYFELDGDKMIREINKNNTTKDSFDAGFQVASDWLFFTKDNILYRYKDGVQEKKLNARVQKFLIDDYFIFTDDEDNLFFLVNDSFENIAKNVISFNKFKDLIYFSTNEGLFTFNTKNDDLVKLISQKEIQSNMISL